MRRTALVVAVAALAAPAAAHAKTIHYSGHSTRDPMVVFSFDAVGSKEIGRKGLPVPAKVTNFSVLNVDYTCGGPVPSMSTRRSDLPFGSIGPLRVDKYGNFRGSFTPPSPPNLPNGRFSVTGNVRKRKTSGTFLGSEGINGMTLACTTGGHRWVATPAG